MNDRASMRVLRRIRAIERPRATTAAVCFFFLLSILFLLASTSRLHAAQL